MSRASNGTYTLPAAGNPVVTGTVISSTWANTTLSDIATALTDSLSRSGLGGMSASLALADGLIGAPGLSWGTEPTSGLYRVSAGVFAYSVGAAQALTIALNALGIKDGTSLLPSLTFISDVNTGIYRVSSDNFAAVAGATVVQQWLLNGAAPQAAFPDGVVATPSLTFAADTNTGLYRVSADNMGVAIGGINTVQFIPTANQFLVQVQSLDGTVGVPAYSFFSDPDTGVYRDSVNDLKFATGGTRAFALDSNQNIRGNDGTAALPYYSFFSDSNTGLYRVGADNFAATAGGSVVQQWVLNGATAQSLFSDGTAGIPGLSFGSDTDTGIYRSSANVLSISTAGSDKLDISSAFISSTIPFLSIDGSAASPSFSFNSDTDTGFYRDTANQIAIALAGVTAGQIAQGTFTLTGTGFTAGVTATVKYQRVGNHVTINSPAFVGTSNTTAFTGTGLPAIIQPSAHTGGGQWVNASDNSVTVTDANAFIAAGSGTITFQRAGSATGWTNANQKGFALGFTLSYLV
jgi:hypothetical protein